MSDWFFQMVFVATTASIVSGALAERVKIWPFFLFILVLTAVIYPVVGAWTWGGGWLSQMGIQDFAGSTIVHSTGGWAALAGVMIAGARLGNFRRNGEARTAPPSNVLIVTLGIFILWSGWFGFIGGSQLKLGTASDAIAMSNVPVNTNLAAGGDFVTQLVGDLAIGAFVFAVSWLLWKALALSPLGIRVERDVEELGQDAGELGIEAYPEFVLMSETYDD